MIECHDISAGYGGSSVLKGVNLRAELNTITGIIGPNGAGKSTLLKVLMGFLCPTRGEVMLKGQAITRARPDERIRLGIAYVAQSRSSFPELSVTENLRLGAYLIRKKDVLDQRLEQVFKRFPVLRQRRNQPAGLLSGGELRMLEVGRFLMMEPQLVILDEPSIGLAPRLVDMVYGHLEDLKREGITLLIVEQNVLKLLSVAGYVYTLEMGCNRFEGTPEYLLKEGHLSGLYLGTSDAPNKKAEVCT